MLFATVGSAAAVASTPATSAFSASGVSPARAGRRPGPTPTVASRRSSGSSRAGGGFWRSALLRASRNRSPVGVVACFGRPGWAQFTARWARSPGGFSAKRCMSFSARRWSARPPASVRPTTHTRRVSETIRRAPRTRAPRWPVQVIAKRAALVPVVRVPA